MEFLLILQDFVPYRGRRPKKAINGHGLVKISFIVLPTLSGDVGGPDKLINLISQFVIDGSKSLQHGSSFDETIDRL